MYSLQGRAITNLPPGLDGCCSGQSWSRALYLVLIGQLWGALALFSLPRQFLASPSSPIALSKAAMASLGFWSGLHPFFLFSIYPHRGLESTLFFVWPGPLEWCPKTGQCASELVCI